MLLALVSPWGYGLNPTAGCTESKGSGLEFQGSFHTVLFVRREQLIAFCQCSLHPLSKIKLLRANGKLPEKSDRCLRRDWDSQRRS